MSATFFLGERGGGRILAYGDAITQVGTNFQAAIETWDIMPAGEVGDCLFRSIDVTFIAEAGYAIGITPVVDGEALSEQTFSGAGTGEMQAQAFFAMRGTRCSARIRTTSRAGDIDLHNIQLTYVPLRQTP